MPFDVGPTLNGKIDEVRVRASAATEGRLRTEALNYLAPHDLYGIGEEDAADASNLSPVALPTFITVDQDTLTTVPFTSRAVEPQNEAKTLVSVTQPTNGVSSINANEPRYRSNPGFSGEDRFTATVRDPAGKLSTAPIIVTVRPPVAPPALVMDDILAPMLTTDTSVDIDILEGAEFTPAGADTPTILATDIVTPPAAGTATVVNPGTANALVRYNNPNPAVGDQLIDVRARGITFPTVTDVARATVRISGGGVVEAAYNWAYALPGVANLDPNRIRLWNLPAAPPPHQPGDWLLAVLPAGNVTRTNFDYGGLRGPMIVIGGDLHPVPNRTGTGGDAGMPGMQYIFRINFAADAESHARWATGDAVDGLNGGTVDWPFFWASNIRMNYTTNNCQFGDFSRIEVSGAQMNAANGDPRGPKCGVFYNKIYLERGGMYTDILNGSTTQNGHTDWLQSFGGCYVVRCGDCWWDFPRGQLIFCGQEPTACGFPRRSRWSFRNCFFRHGDPWGGFDAGGDADMCMGFEGRGNGELSSDGPDTYHAWRFDTLTYCAGRVGIGSADAIRYINPQRGINGINQATGMFNFSATAQGNHSYPPCSGQLRYLPPGSTYPPLNTIVNPAHTGSAARVTSIARFREILGV
jgi:hypothetical protein